METLYGRGLRRSIVSEAGEFLFIDRDVRLGKRTDTDLTQPSASFASVDPASDA